MVDWDSLVREHRGGVYGIAWRILGHAQDAEDVVQEVFAAAHQHPNGDAVKCWPALLRRMAACKALDALRRRRVTIALDKELQGTPRQGPEQLAVANELRRRLRAALAELAPREAEVFCLRYFEEYSYQEIAGAVGISVTAVSTALYQARAHLEQLLSESAK